MRGIFFQMSSIWLMVLLCYSCSRESIWDSLTEIKINNGKSKDEVLADSIFQLEILPLDTQHAALLTGLVSNITIDENRIFITDSRVDQSLFIFDSSGKFINVLKRGVGPSYFASLYRSTIDRKRKLIEIFDREKFRLLYYDYDGVYQFSHPVPTYYNYKIRLDDNLRLYDCYGMANINYNTDVEDFTTYSLYILDSLFWPQQNHLPYPPEISLVSYFQPWPLFFRVNDTLHYYRPFLDTIYQLTDLAIQRKYAIRFSRNAPPSNLSLNKGIQDPFIYCTRNGKPFLSQVYEQNDFLVINYYYNSSERFVLWDIQEQKEKMNTKILFFAKEGIRIYPPQTSAGNGKDLVRLVSAHSLKHILDEAAKKQPLWGNYKRLRENWSTSSNAYLVKYRFK